MRGLRQKILPNHLISILLKTYKGLETKHPGLSSRYVFNFINGFIFGALLENNNARPSCLCSSSFSSTIEIHLKAIPNLCQTELPIYTPREIQQLKLPFNFVYSKKMS